MATLRELMSQVKRIEIGASGPLVERTVAAEIRNTLAPAAAIEQAPGMVASAGALRLGVADGSVKEKTIHPALAGKDRWMLARVNKDKGIELLVSSPHLLYGLFCLANEEWASRDAGEFTSGKIAVPAFPEMRPAYDLFLTQHARTVRGFNREARPTRYERTSLTQKCRQGFHPYAIGTRSRRLP